MKVFAIILALVGVSSAATILTMSDREFEKAMADQMFVGSPSHPMMGMGAFMATHLPKEQDAAVVGDSAPVGDRDARQTEESYDDHNDEPAEDSPQQPFNMFSHGMMAMGFPEMFGGSASPNVAARRPSNNGQAVSPNNGQAVVPKANGNSRPTNGNHRPSNGNSRPGNNGNRGGGSAAAASATSFSKGSNSYSGSQAQAFGGFFGQ